MKAWVMSGFALGLFAACGSKTADTDVATAAEDVEVAADAAVDTAEDSTAVADVLNDAGPIPTGNQLVLGDLTVDLLAKKLTLTWKGAPRTTLDLTRLRFGRVANWSADYNYSPDHLKDSPPDDLTWFHPVTLEWAAGPAVLLHTADDKGAAGPDYRLAIAQQAPGYKLRLEPADLALATALQKDQVATDALVYVGIRAQVPKTERFYGLGEYFDTPQHRGKVRTMQIVVDTSIESGYNEAHVPIPLLIGTLGWGLFVQDRHPGIFDVAASQDDEVEALFNQSAVDFWLLTAEKSLEITGQYTQITGAPVLPAKWAFGTLIWRNENKDQAEVLADMQKIRDLHLMISGMWLDRPFDVAVNDFGFDPNKFSDPKTMVQKIHDLGFRMGEWSTPYLDPGPNNPKAKHREEAESKGYFVQSPLGDIESKLSQWGAPLDLTNPDALAFWKGLIKQAADAGVEGWKMDYGEDIQVGILSARTHFSFFDGSDERTMHHGYHAFYHRPYAESLPATGGWLLSRAGTYGDQIYSSIIWPGDLCASWAHHRECDKTGNTCHTGGLPASVSAGISLPASGYPLFGPDTGGYKHGRASKELFLRWLGHSTFLGILQIGGSSQENPWDFTAYDGNEYAPGGISQFDQEVLDTAKNFISIHTRLFPYIYSYAMDAHNHKPTLIRALGLQFPALNDFPGIADFENTEYLFGEDLLIAPITQPGGKRKVLIPQGMWYDWWTHAQVGLPNAATVIEVDLPMTQSPIYVRGGSLLAMLRPTIDTLAPTSTPGIDTFDKNPGRLYVTTAFGGEQDRTLYDGTVLGVHWTPTNSIGIELSSQPGTDFQKDIQWQLWLDAKHTAGLITAKKGKQDVQLVASQSDLSVSACTDCWSFNAGSGAIDIRTSIGTTVTVRIQ